MPADLVLPTGELMQRPPAYSAVKVAGERAYKRARRGEAVETVARPVTVHRFELLWREGERAGFEVECSAGTYVRSLVSDLGDAYCDELERVAIGPFALDRADPERVVPVEEALAFLPAHELGRGGRRGRGLWPAGARRGRGRAIRAPLAMRASCSRSANCAMTSSSRS